MAVIEVMSRRKRIRKITVSALYARLADKFPVILAMADTLAVQGDYTLKAQLMRIDKGEFVDLDDPDLKPGLDKTGEFSAEELEAVFVDGTIAEVPEILKKV